MSRFDILESMRKEIVKKHQYEVLLREVVKDVRHYTEYSYAETHLYCNFCGMNWEDTKPEIHKPNCLKLRINEALLEEQEDDDEG